MYTAQKSDLLLYVALGMHHCALRYHLKRWTTKKMHSTDCRDVEILFHFLCEYIQKNLTRWKGYIEIMGDKQINLAKILKYIKPVDFL